MRNVQQTFTHIIEEVPYLPEELQIAVANLDDPTALSHLIAGALRIKAEEKQALLEEVDVAKRLRRLSEILARELEVVAIGSKIQSQVQSEMDKAPARVRPAPAAQGDPGASWARTTSGRGRGRRAARAARRASRCPRTSASRPTASSRAWRSCRRRRPSTASSAPTSSGSPSLPWDKTTEDNLDLKHARAVLDEDHYDIEQVKDRILEFLAVRKLKPDARGSILCFVGPPGVGKTSLGRSIARALGRKFERISAGGVRDEAEIRGHRRTYIGAMPGTIIRALRDAGVQQPALHDRRDRQDGRRLPRRPGQRDARGARPRAELHLPRPLPRRAVRPLERAVHHHGNTLDTIPRPLRDRMEIIQLAGYTEEEKLEIAKRYLVPRQIERNGLKTLADRVLRRRRCRTIIADYTREAGVRNLEREIGTVCRKVARQVGRGPTAGRRRTHDHRRRACASCSGRPRFIPETKRRTPRAGRGHRAGVDAGRRRRALHRGHGDAGQGQADHHRPARRRDEGVRAGRALLRARPRPSSPRRRPRVVRRRTTSTSTCRRARSPRTARAPASRWPPRWCRSSPGARCATTSR